MSTMSLPISVRSRQSRRGRSGRVAILTAIAACSLWAQPRLTPKKIQAIEREISSEMTRQSIPGISVAVSLGGELTWTNGFGLSDLENYVPVKSSTVFRLGSISKPITAVAAMQLYESGRLDLDAPVQKYLPAFPS